MNPKIEKQLRQILRQFKLTELFDMVFPLHNDWVRPVEISNEIKRLKLKTNLQSIIDIYVTLLKDKKIGDKDIQEKLPHLMLLGVAYNAPRKTWTAITLRGDPDPEQFDQNVEDNIKHAFLENNLHVAVTVECLDSLHWVQVIEKKLTRGRLKVKAPLYIAHFIGEPYLFLSAKSTPNEILQALAEGFGHTGYKCSNLDGQDLDSLLKHLNQKGSKRGFAEPFPSLDKFKEMPSGRDFSQHAKRRKFITDVMGPSPPKLSNYIVMAKNLPWKGKMNLPSMRTKTFDMKIELRTSDTVGMLKDMAEHSILKIPPPSYVTNLMSTGKNNIKLRVQGATGATDTETQTDA